MTKEEVRAPTLQEVSEVLRSQKKSDRAVSDEILTEIHKVHQDALDDCEIWSSRYKKCMKKWWYRSALQGDVTHKCDDHWDSYQACLVDYVADRGWDHLQVYGPARPSHMPRWEEY